jgi:hypothetical protein
MPSEARGLPINCGHSEVFHHEPRKSSVERSVDDERDPMQRKMLISNQKKNEK